jgi:general secretion pathway protein E
LIDDSGLDNSGNYTGRDRLLGVDELLTALVEDGHIQAGQRERLLLVLDESDQTFGHPLIAIAAQTWVSGLASNVVLDLERLVRWLAERTGLPYARIDPLKVDVAAVTNVIKQAYASRFSVLPIAIDAGIVTVATAEPFVREWEHELGEMQKLRFRRVLVNPVSLQRYLREFYAIGKTLAGAAADQRASANHSANLEQLIELNRVGEHDANDRHIVRLVDWLLQYAFEQRASDVHLEPRREMSNVRFRIDGVLHVVNELPTRVITAVISRLKSLGRLDVVERRRPQGGRIKTRSPGGREVELRLSTMPTTFGEKLVMRIFDPDVLVKSFGELGVSDAEEAQWRSIIDQPHGMVVVTGPTGSGKTTTLYSLLKYLARPEHNVCTIEDPIELIDPALNQMQVQSSIGLDFANGVRTLLRQDPDIIMVGEIRDEETAQTAFQAALTGHLVLTTLHTNDAAATITRFLDLGIAPYLLKSALVGVIAQRLVRTLCPFCKVLGKISADEWHSLVEPFKMPKPEEIRSPVGCDECRHTGYRGRVGIYEILRMSDALRSHITGEPDLGVVRASALREGMRTLRVSGAEKVASGLTSSAEIFTVVQR